MDREDFIFTIGFEGNSAIVDKTAKRKYGKLNSAELLAQGLYKAAFCSALFSHNSEEFERIVKELAAYYAVESPNADYFKRLFGIYDTPAESVRVTYV